MSRFRGCLHTGQTSALHDFGQGMRKPSAPSVVGATYDYLVREVANRVSPVAYNVYNRLLPQTALQKLFSHHSWGVHIGGDDLINTFDILDPNMGGLYYPACGTPHQWLESIINKHPRFYIQPILNNDPLSAKNDPTICDWCERTATAMDKNKSK